MRIVLAKGKLVKLFKASVVRESSQRKVKAGRLLSPRVYSAEYFGHKTHYDQSEKLGIHGAVNGCARDGYSGMIVEFATMAIKNCLTIHDQIYL